MSLVEETISGYKLVYQDRSGAEARLSSWQVDLTGFRFFNFDVRRSCAVEFAVARSVSPVAAELGCEVLDLSFANIVTKRLFGNVVRLWGSRCQVCKKPELLLSSNCAVAGLFVCALFYICPTLRVAGLDFNLFWGVTERSVRLGLARGNLAFNGTTNEAAGRSVPRKVPNREKAGIG